MTMAYNNSLEYLMDELSLLDTRLSLAVSRFRDENRKNDNDWNKFSGLYITDEEIDSIIQKSKSKISARQISHEAYEWIEKMTFKINERKSESTKKKMHLSLPHLSQVFSLSDFEINMIIICLAPEIDSKYEKFYAYLQNDITKKRPTMGFILDLLCTTIEEKIYSRRYFHQSAPLFKFRILEFDESQSDSQSLLSKPLKIDRHIINFLLSLVQIDPKIEPFSKLVTTKDYHTIQIRLHEDLKNKICSHIQKLAHDKNKGGPVFYFQGPYGIGKKTLALSVSSELGVPILIVNIAKISNHPFPVDEIIVHFLREALLQGASLYLDNLDILFETNDEKSNKIRDSVMMYLRDFTGLLFFAGEKSWKSSRFENSLPLTIDFPSISYSVRKKVWSLLLKPYSIENDISIDLANKFRFTPGQIKDAVASALNLAAIEHENKSTLSVESLYKGCGLQCNEKLASFAKKTEPKYRLDDIILPKGKKKQLEEVINHAKYRNQVYSEWGFEEKLSLGKGLNILFAGESGTGKTMAAQILANELNLELYKIDLSLLMSKYIGETEKNINSIFKEAETSNAILFFDEADAIFGKRSEVQDAHDRYANVEINYLLQKLEEHKEIVILASNFPKNIDHAFIRRMHFWIEFSFPDEQNRLEIWKKVFPDKAKLDNDDIDFKFLAKKFNITGGNIKNIALASAFLAASESSSIKMKHLILAAKREFEKIGKPCTKSEFEKYYDLIQNLEE